jgi:hypothetical protein
METFTLYINSRRAVVICVTLGFALPYTEGHLNRPDPVRQTTIVKAAGVQLDEMPRIGIVHATAALPPVTGASQPYKL